MLSRFRTAKISQVRPYAHLVKSKAIFAIDDKVHKMIEQELFKPRKHPGISYPGIIVLPKKIIDIIKPILEDANYKTFLQQAKNLENHLKGKHPPTETRVYSALYQKVLESLNEEYDLSDMPSEVQEKMKQKNEQDAVKYLKSKIHTSEAEVYDEKTSLMYLLGRSVQDYAVLTTIFNEIKKRDPDYLPKSIFDFGSGIGTVMWAADNTWPEKVNQYYGVDISAHIITMAETIIKQLRPDLKKLFFRQYFPASLMPDYDMTISSYTTMELPDAKERVNSLYKLWKKTKKYMVVIERGTSSGFNLINEAREFILHASKCEENHDTHVFAPCPHDMTCPKLQDSENKPCTFEVIYQTLPFFGVQKLRNDLFSYVVFKKAPRQEEEWPRIVYPANHRSKHSWCNICTSDGKIHRTVFTKSKHGPYLYRCVKASDWGDRIPVHKVSEGTEEQDKKAAQSDEPLSDSGSAV